MREIAHVMCLHNTIATLFEINGFSTVAETDGRRDRTEIQVHIGIVKPKLMGKACNLGC